MNQDSLSSEELGFQKGSRLLIVNIDDFGMCNTVNTSAMETIAKGIAGSCTIMIPCPWSIQGAQLLLQHKIPHGVHLTAISEHRNYRWKPLLSREQIPTLIDDDGFFPLETAQEAFIINLNVDELRAEWRAQIETAFKMGLTPNHLDSHCNVHDSRDDILQMTIQLACEYGLALRIHHASYINQLKGQGLLTLDHPDVDSFSIPTEGKNETFVKMLRKLPEGISEWAIHPARETDELTAITDQWGVRAADYAFFNSIEALQVINEEKIELITYEQLQPYWKMH